MNAQEKVKDVANNVTNAAQNVANKAQNLVNNTTNKVKNAGKQSAAKLQSVSQDAKVMANAVGNNIKMLTSMLCSPALVYLAIGATALSSSFIDGMDTSMFGVRWWFSVLTMPEVIRGIALPHVLHTIECGTAVVGFPSNRNE